MANNVFANGREISCKAADGKSICAFPDVCFTPPQTPATPPGVPIPYPNTGFAKDTTKGSKKVKISKKEIMLKNKSYFKKSTGNEAGNAPKKGIVTSKNRGKVYFNSWSMNVKIEGKNVVRHLDMTTHNHASPPTNTPPWPYADSMAIGGEGPQDPCKKDKDKEEKACEGVDDPCPPDGKPTKASASGYADKTAANECLAARRCKLVPYKPKSGEDACCPGQTGHHLVEAASFFKTGRKGLGLAGTEEYSTDRAPCICAEGTNQYHGTHGLMHTFQSTAAMNSPTIGTSTLKLSDGTEMPIETKQSTYGKAKQQGIDATKKTFPESDCDKKCLEAQLDNYHKKCGVDDETACKQVVTGYKGDMHEAAAKRAVLERSNRIRSSGCSRLAGGR